MTVYDSANRELRTNSDYFREKRDNAALTVLSIVWGVDSGDEVHPGDELGTVQWSDNSREPVRAPGNLSGQVASVNRNITYEVLARRPQWLLRLTGNATTVDI